MSALKRPFGDIAGKPSQGEAGHVKKLACTKSSFLQNIANDASRREPAGDTIDEVSGPLSRASSSIAEDARLPGIPLLKRQSDASAGYEICYGMASFHCTFRIDGS